VAGILRAMAAVALHAGPPVLVPEAMAPAAEMLPAHASVQSADAARHVGTLADDAFEGREGGSRGGRAAAAYIVEQLTRLGLEPAGDGGTYYQAVGSLRNVLAIVRGGDPAVAGELVVVGAHYDHVGYGRVDNSFGPFGFVHNGADDNASGVAGLLEIAEALKQLPTPPRRSVLLAFWDGEEQGLLGSRHFVRVRPAPLAQQRVVFSVNLDMIGRLRGGRLEVYGTRTAGGMRSAVVRVNNDPATAAGLELAFDWDIQEDSDHYPFIAAGIPTVMFHTGLHDNYHRPSDDVGLVNFDGIEPVTRLALGFVMTLADSPAPLPEFRAAGRGESNAARRGLEAPAPEPPGAPRGRWGIGVRPDPAEPGAAVVVRVSRDSPASAGGLQTGDRIVAVDGQPYDGQPELLERLAGAGATTSLTVDRRGRLVQLDIDSGSRRP